MLERRKFLIGLGSLIAAPAIVRTESLMKIAAPKLIIPNQNVLLTRNAIEIFYNSNNFIQYSDEFAIEGAKIGSTLRIRLPNDYLT